MKSFSYKECLEHTGINNIPVEAEVQFNIFSGKPHNENDFKIIDFGFLIPFLKETGLSSKNIEKLQNAVNEIKKDEILTYLTAFIISDMCSARNRCDCDSYTNMTPTCMKEYSEFYSFILLAACIEPSITRMKKIGIEEEIYRKIPVQMLRKQCLKLEKDNNPYVEDFPWDMNFYTCSIFYLERFFFIPYKFGDEFVPFRNRTTNEVVCLYKAGQKVRSTDGQLDGVNGIHDENAFTTIWEENENSITANKINPLGFIEKEPVNLTKTEWKQELKEGDILLALHIPSGPGYDPEHVKSSMGKALAFFGRNFPEFDIKGFWSESWLYDPLLSLLLPDNKNIVRVQRQFYNYPVTEGDHMIYYELFGSWDSKPTELTTGTSLQVKAADFMRKGRRFNTTGMIFLKDEVAKIGTNPFVYVKEKDITHFKKNNR